MCIQMNAFELCNRKYSKMSDPESCLKFAISTVSIHANSVWWAEGQDSYRLANLSLWLDYLRSKAPDPSPEDIPEQSDESVNRSWKPPPLEDMDLPEAQCSDPEAWLRGHAWPTAIARNFPAISAALSGSDRASLYQYSKVLERMYEANQPYKIETLDEMRLYRKTSKESIKKIWAKSEPTQRKKDPSLNANVPEFYPSVLFHNVEFPQSYPPITDHTYHMDLFPYHEQNIEQEGQWHAPQVQVYPNINSDSFGETRARSNPGSFANLLLLQKAQKGPLMQTQLGGSQPHAPLSGPQHRLPIQVFLGPTSQHQQHILLNSEFPELPPHRGNEQSTVRRPGLQDLCSFPGKSAAEMMELNTWLEKAYRERAAVFADIAAAANAFEELARRSVSHQPGSPTKQESQCSVPDRFQDGGISEECITPTSIQANQKSRRLYRDVLTSKGEDDSETTLEGKFEELEREALEQYISSENSGEVVESNESPENDDPYQDLERQAVEQYEEQDEIGIDSSSFIPLSNSQDTPHASLPSTSTEASPEQFHFSKRISKQTDDHSALGTLQMDGKRIRIDQKPAIRLSVHKEFKKWGFMNGKKDKSKITNLSISSPHLKGVPPEKKFNASKPEHISPDLPNLSQDGTYFNNMTGLFEQQLNVVSTKKSEMVGNLSRNMKKINE